MRTLYFSAVVILFTAFACSQKEENSHDNQISIGTKDSLYSKVLNENREIWVYQPPDLKPGEKCPVVYLLDGNWHFHAVSGMIDKLADNSLVPRMILIGILNTDRSRDLTPTHSAKMVDGTTPDFLKTTGGGEVFTTFVEKELMPYVESKYQVAPYKVLIGHSFGGLFAMNTLIHHPQMFNAYVSIDPSMWWDGRRLLQQADSALRAGKYPGRMLYLSVANTMEPGMDTVRVAKDTSNVHEHIRAIFELAKVTSRSGASGLVSQWKYYDADDHGSVPFISEYDAFRFIFSYFKSRGNWRDQTPADITKHFEMVSEKLGYEMLPPEDMVENIVYSCLGAKKLDKAMEFFELNRKNYPGSAGVLQTEGELFLVKGDTAKAIDLFEQAIAKRDNFYLRNRLKDLKK